MTDLATNVLYYGDNLDILRRYLPDAAVDLVHLDPPFNSNRDSKRHLPLRVRQRLHALRRVSFPLQA